jgi:hypothetical protein
MFKHKNIIWLVLGLALVAVFTTACGLPETITETITEADFNADDPEFCQDVGETADFQSGKIVCSGEFQGETVVFELTLEIVGRGARFQLQSLTADGKDASSEAFADLNAGLAEDVYMPEEEYAVTSVSITDDELTITSSLQEQ